jgi:hypothetical protein
VLECIPQQIEHALPSWQVGVIPELEAEGFSGLTVKPERWIWCQQIETAKGGK